MSTEFKLLLYFLILPAFFVAVVIPLFYMTLEKLRKKNSKLDREAGYFAKWLEKKSPGIKESLVTICVIIVFLYWLFEY